MVFFFNCAATTEIFALTLHVALPIGAHGRTTEGAGLGAGAGATAAGSGTLSTPSDPTLPPCAMTVDFVTGSSESRSEEHTSELQSQYNLVCRLLLDITKNLAAWALAR